MHTARACAASDGTRGGCVISDTTASGSDRVGRTHAQASARSRARTRRGQPCYRTRRTCTRACGRLLGTDQKSDG